MRTAATGSFIVLLTALSLGSATAGSTAVNFDDAKPGSLPAGWMAGVTGRGTPAWAVKQDDTAPSKPNVLAQTGSGTFPFCILEGTKLTDGFVEVKFKPVSGREDQAGGVIWRFKDKDNYYIARANALEDNVTIYHTVRGVRRQFKSLKLRVSSGIWHTLRVDFKATHFTVSLDGKVAIRAVDAAFREPGAVGVWTKADSETYFDDFTYGPTK